MNEPSRRARSISLSVTDLCNQRCAYCYNHDRYMSGQCLPDVSTAELLEVVDLIAASPFLRQIEITGGEPFLRRDLPAIVDHIHSKGLSIGILSNASRIDSPMAAELAQKRISHVQTTFLAPDAQRHDAIAGPGSFAARRAGVERLVDAGVPMIGAFVCTKDNYALTGETLESMYAWGMRDHLFFMRFCPSRHSVKNRDRLAIGQQELLVALAQANAFGAAHDITVHNKIPIPQCLLVDPGAYPRLLLSSCGAAMEGSDCYVDQRGNVRLCASNDETLGNLRVATLDKLLRSEAARTWRDNCAPACAPCDLRATCLGGCPIAVADPMLNEIWVKTIGRFRLRL